MPGQDRPEGPALEGRIFTSLGFQPQVVFRPAIRGPCRRVGCGPCLRSVPVPPGVETPGWWISAPPGRV